MLVKILAQTQNVAKTQTILTFVSSKSQNLPAISILIKVSHFNTKTHEKTLCNLIFSYLSHKIIYFYIGKFYPKKYWIFTINLVQKNSIKKCTKITNK